MRTVVPPWSRNTSTRLRASQLVELPPDVAVVPYGDILTATDSVVY